MDKLEKKVLHMKGLVSESMKTLENLSKPKINPLPVSGVQKPEAPAKPNSTQSKKDPTKMAEQLTNADAKKEAMDSIKTKTNLLKFNKNGQWSLAEDEDNLN